MKEVTRLTVATRREHEQLLRRETIIEAARKLFQDKGYDLTTVEEIAVMAELGKGTIYSYFKSKDEIYIAILESEFAILEERMNRVIVNFTTAENALKKLYETFIQYNQERRGFIKAIFLQIEQQPSLKMTEIVCGLKEKSAKWSGLVAYVLQKGIDNGEFEEFIVERMANAIIGLILGLIVQSEMGQIKEDLSSYRDTLFHLLLGGISRRARV
jgi:AcrR family transcriptional regulator